MRGLESKSDEVSKRTYQSPKLEVLGSVSALTASGSANQMENDMSNPPRVGPTFNMA